MHKENIELLKGRNPPLKYFNNLRNEFDNNSLDNIESSDSNLKEECDNSISMEQNGQVKKAQFYSFMSSWQKEMMKVVEDSSQQMEIVQTKLERMLLDESESQRIRMNLPLNNTTHSIVSSNAETENSPCQRRYKRKYER